jgi:VWFA-related protein
LKQSIITLALIFLCIPVFAQQQEAAPAQGPAVKATAEEVVLDFIVRDKKGKPITDLKPEDVTVLDNGSKQEIKSFRLVRGEEAISTSPGAGTGSTVTLDPLRQIRLVTLAFKSMGEGDQRKTARQAAIDLVKGEQGTNVFYSVVMINTRLLVLQEFTSDRAALTKAIEQATTGSALPKLISASDAIKSQLRTTVASAAPAAPTNAATAAAAGAAFGAAALNARLASVMLEMLKMDSSVAADDARLDISALASLVNGLQTMPGRKSVIYFTWGMYVTPELDTMFRNLLSNANRNNVTFYSVDTRGVMTYAQNSGAVDQLAGAASASAATVTRTGGAVTKEEIMASDNAEQSSRANVQMPIRDLAESTGGFLIGDSNDLRAPLRKVNEEIASYYELTYNPGIKNYDGAFRKLKVDLGRKDVVIHARNGYFALPPEARAAGLMPYEMPLLKAISDGAKLDNVPFRSAAVRLQPKKDATDVSVLVEVPLQGLQPRNETAQNKAAVHFSLAALVKDANGEVVQKLSRDHSLFVTPDQLKMANFVEKIAIALPPGKYTLTSAVMDRETAKMGTQQSEFTVPARGNGVAISSMTAVRSYTPNVKGLDPNDAYQFQGGSITPTLNNHVPRSKDSALRLFFTIYQDGAISSPPSVEVEFLQGGASLTKVSLPLDAADSQGRIPSVMTIPAASIPPGNYVIRAVARQGSSTAEAKTGVVID